MTDYPTSSQASLEHMNAHQRTAHWVQSHIADHLVLLSPSVPPSVLSDVSYDTVSETESMRSVPPRMVLRYNDGRPDIPIPLVDTRSRPRHRQDDSSSSGSRVTSPTSGLSQIYPSSHYDHRARSGSQSLSRPLPPNTSLALEEIRILPSQPHPPTSNNPPRSQSLPRTTERPQASQTLPGPMSAPQGQSHGAFQTWHPYVRGSSHQRQKQPLALAYAPADTNTRPQYPSTAVFHHPPTVGPDGMVYSHSAPVPLASRHKYNGSAPAAAAIVPPSRTVTGFRGRQQRQGVAWDRGRDMRPQLPALPRRTSSPSSFSSQVSEGTYYVAPQTGQKVHIIHRSPNPSILTTATSITKAPNSPPYSPGKKTSFLKRLLSLAGRFRPLKSSAASMKEDSGPPRGRRLQRRHSTGGTPRSRSCR